MKRIAILASGAGTNAENIIKYFADSSDIEVAMVLSNKPTAKVHERAMRLGVPTYTFTREQWNDGAEILKLLQEQNICFVVLAGFMAMIAPAIVRAFDHKMVNIHPALLPRFGGKGMFGMNVHQAVLEAGERESGITIHYVNEHYDEGAIIYSHSCDITQAHTAEEIANLVHALEYKYYPRVINDILHGKNQIVNNK